MCTEKIKKKKILLLFYEPYKSGISRHLRYIVHALKSENCDFWLLYSSNDLRIRDLFTGVIPSTNIYSVPANRFFSLKGLVKTRSIIRREEIDIVHIHNLQTILWGYGGAKAAGCSCIIFTPHIIAECAGHNWFFRIGWRKLASLSTRLIALSHAQKEWLVHRKILNEKKVSVISNHISEHELIASNAVNRSTPDSSILAEKDLKDRFVVAQIGRLDRQKNPFFLLKVALMMRDCPEIIFVFVGEGPLRKKLEKAVSTQNLQDNVVIAGHQDNITGVLKLSDIVSLTSRWEGMPYALLEAVCFKKAVIATDIPGNRELIIDGENGFLVGDEKVFSKRLITLFNEPHLRRQMGESGYRKNRHLFDINGMKKALIKLYGL